MIKWYDNLYLTPALKKKHLQKIKKAMEEEKLTVGIYCIILAVNPANLFDIINANELLIPYYKRQRIYMIGMANGKIEAEELVVSLLEEIYQKTGGFHVREYYKFNKDFE